MDTEIENLITETANRIPTIVADLTASDAAHADLLAVETTLLDRIAATVRPALRAIGTRPLISSASSGGADGCNPWSEAERATWRGIWVSA